MKGKQASGPVCAVALASIEIEFGNISKNRRAILSAIGSAIKSGADVVCLPEYCSSGYDYGNESESVGYAEKLAGNAFVAKLRKISSENRIDIVIGSLEKLNGRVYNAGLYISGGKLLLKHHKIREGGPVTPGTEVVAVKTRFGRAAVIICGDLFTPAVIDKLIRLKPDFVFMPMDRCLHWMALCRNYKTACENGCSSDKKRLCYERGFRSWKDVWTSRSRGEYAAEVKKYGVETFIVNGLSSKGHRLACGGAMHISGNGTILDEIPYGKSGIIIVRTGIAGDGSKPLE